MLTTQRGFSLAELMVVIAIMGILAAIAIPEFNQWIADNRVRVKIESLIGGIHQGRAAALKHNARVSFTFNADTSWTLRCVTVTANCPSPIETRGAGDGGSGVTLTSANNATMLTFSGVGTVVPNADGSQSITQVDFTATNARTMRLNVSATGQTATCISPTPGGNPTIC